MIVAIDAVGIRLGGGARVLCDLIELLPDYRPDWKWEVFVLPEEVRAFDLPPENSRVRYHTVPIGNRSLGRLLWVSILLPHAVKNAKADVLLSLSNLPTSRPPVPSIVFFHQPNMVERQSVSGLAKRIRMAGMGELFFSGSCVASKILVQTETMRSALARQYPPLEKLIVTIPSGFSERPPAGVVREEVRAQIDRCSGPRILYVAYGYKHKNHTTLIRAFAKVQESLPGCSLLLTLPPPGAPRVNGAIDSLDLPAIHRVARAAGMEQSIEWLGPISAAEVAYAFQNVDLMVFPSLTESFGLPLVEAMVFGCPIAAADRSYAKDVVSDAAAYFDPEDADDMAAVLKETLASSDRLEELRRRGAVHRETFLYRNICPAILEVFEECGRQRPSRSGVLEEYFDRVAPGWERKYSSSGSMHWRMQRFAQAVRDRVRPGARILDAGCGSGDITAACASMGYEMAGIDQSTEMITRARERFSGLGIRFDVHSIAPRRRLPFGDGEFGAFLASSLLEYIDDPGACLAELRRVCTEDAVGFLTVPNSRDLVRVMERVERGGWRLVPKRFGETRRRYLELSRTRLRLDGWKKVCAAAGWDVAEVQDSKTPLLFFVLSAQARKGVVQERAMEAARG